LTKHKTLFFFGFVFVIALVIIIFSFLSPLVFLPHQRITIILPFSAADDAKTSLIPMGELIEHNAQNGNPDGHAGIDFGWGEKVAIIASHDGLITGVQNSSEGQNVTITNGYYKTVYKELFDLAPEIKLFAHIKQGDLIGYPKIQSIGGNMHGQLHWEFSSSSMLLDRLCPLGYFNNDSRIRIEKIWQAVPANDRFKQEFPEICNGKFQGKED